MLAFVLFSAVAVVGLAYIFSGLWDIFKALLMILYGVICWPLGIGMFRKPDALKEAEKKEERVPCYRNKEGQRVDQFGIPYL